MTTSPVLLMVVPSEGTVVASSEDGVVVVLFAGVVTGGRVPVASNPFGTGAGKVAAVNTGDRVGLGYGHSIFPWTMNTTHELVN